MSPPRPGFRTDPEVLSVARRVAAIVREVTGDPAYRTLLFGSWASGEPRERSDIDIGIEGPAEVRPAAMVEIRGTEGGRPLRYRDVFHIDGKRVRSLTVASLRGRTVPRKVSVPPRSAPSHS